VKSKAFGVSSFYQAKAERKALPEHASFNAIEFSRYASGEKYSVLRHYSERKDTEAIANIVEASGLCGCGGAYFPVAKKWKAAFAEGGARYLVVNAQEGERYTFKDYLLMKYLPQLLVEGAVLAALANEVRDIYIIVNSAYEECLTILRQECAAFAQAFPALRLNITVTAGPDPDIYVCGEETALMQYMNGHRGEPQLRPPFPFQKGFRGKPTLIHNVETLCWIPILLDQPDIFLKKGQLKLLYLWGEVNHPGIYDAPLGTRLEELLRLAGGMKKGAELHAIEIGGMAGGMLPASSINTPLEHNAIRAGGAMLGTGSVRFLDTTTDLLLLSKEATQFFRDESCGRCSACRVGTQVLAQLLDEMQTGGLSMDLEARIGDVAETLVNASLCALGKGAPNHFLSYLRYWR
jgi:formate dehydrogenase